MTSENKEEQVFRLSGADFDTSKCYEFALKTRTEGNFPREKHYTTNKLRYLGKYTGREDWGYGDNSGGAVTFVNGEETNRIVYDYDGKTCFREVQCLSMVGGKRKNKTKRRTTKKRRTIRRRR